MLIQTGTSVICFNDPATAEIYTYGHTLSLHDALPIARGRVLRVAVAIELDRAMARLGIDIDEAPVDLPPGGPVPERADGLGEGGVGQHRTVDKHRILGPAPGGMAGQGAWPEGVPRRPGAMSGIHTRGQPGTSDGGGMTGGAGRGAG